MSWTLDPRFAILLNADVLRCIGRTNVSAHSDVASELIDAVQPLPGEETYCPDPARYAFVAAHTADLRIFALSYGLKAFALRVGSKAVAEAGLDGAAPASEFGSDWVQFDPFVVDVKTADMRTRLRAWTARAFAYVSSIQSVQPLRYAVLTSCVAAVSFVNERPAASQSSFLPAFSAILPMSTASVIGPDMPKCAPGVGPPPIALNHSSQWPGDRASVGAGGV